MSYDNPTDAIANLRTMLFLMPTVVGLGWSNGMFHFPSATPVDDSGAAVDALPLFEAEDLGESNPSNIAGGTALGNGTLVLTLAAAMAPGLLEQICRAIAKELRTAETGLPITDAHAGVASDIRMAAEAAQNSPGAAAGQIAYRTCTITISYGMSY